MRKKLLITLAVLMGGFFVSSAHAQLPWPLDISVGQRWIGTTEAGWYGSARTYWPLGFSAFGVEVFGIPELGVDYNSLQPYAAFELNAGTEYGTLAAFVTYMDDVPRINLEARFCILSSACGE